MGGLGHEAGFDYPDGVGADGAGAAGDHGGEDVSEPLLFGFWGGAGGISYYTTSYFGFLQGWGVQWRRREAETRDYYTPP